MHYTQEQVSRFLDFMEKIQNETYPEPSSEVHSGITEQMMVHFFTTKRLPWNAKILDVGCGQGVALEKFQNMGYIPIGITLNEEDVRICKQKGYDVRMMDQSFLDFKDNSFDMVWDRHCIEHSIFPYFTLHELMRVLRPGGYLYMEVPAPDTSGNHQTNPNHYSVLGKSMWMELLQRTGYVLDECLQLNIETDAGPDEYWSFVAHTPSPE